MALTVRMLPSTSGGTVTGWAGSPTANDPSRRYYSASAGQTVDVTPGDESVLVSQDFLTVAPSGTTAARNSLTPSNYFKAGALFVDIALGIVVMWDGFVWRNVVNGNAA